MAKLSDLEIGVGTSGLDKLERDFEQIPNAADDSVSESVSIFKGMGGPIAAAAGAAGLAAGALLVSEFLDAVERDQMSDKLGAQLNLSEQDSKMLGGVAGDLYVEGFGDSLDEIHGAVDAVTSTLVDDLDPGAIEDLTEHAVNLADIFDVDVSESVNAVGVAMSRGLVDDAEGAFDLIVASMQSVPKQMREELIPIIEEYSADFVGLGIDGPEAFGLLSEAAKGGRFVLDKTGDAIREFSIRATDDTAAVSEAYQTLELDAETMQDKIAQGGPTARKAFDTIVESLLGVEDPSTRARTAIELFGAPVEDMSVQDIPKFLTALGNMDTALGNVSGRASKTGENFRDNVATDIEQFQRRASNALDTLLAEHAIPVANKIIAAYEEDGVGGAIDKAVDLWEEAQPKIERWFSGTFMPFWEEEAEPAMLEAGEKLGGVFIEGVIAGVKGLAGALHGALVDSFAEGLANTWPFSLLPQDTVEGSFSPNLPGGAESLEEHRRSVTPAPGSGSSRGRVQRFHDGGFARTGGLAEVADKERVLDPAQTRAFEKLVGQLDGGGLAGGIIIQDGASLIGEVKAYGDRFSLREVEDDLYLYSMANAS